MMKKILTAILAIALITASFAALADASITVSAVPTTVTQVTELAAEIKYGSRDTLTDKSVSELQQKLIDLGYLSGKADGIFGPRTNAALKEFQMANGLTGSGLYDAETKTKMSQSTVVRRDSYVESYYVGNKYDTPNTPDYNTPNDNTPDYDTPAKKTTTTKTTTSTTKKTNYNTYNTPNTPDYNTKNTPDYNTPNTPDYNTPNTPDKNTPDYNTKNTPDYNT